jgi:hypothetical protein
MLGVGEELGGRRDLDDLAGIHQRHAVRHAADDGEVVRDQQHAELALALQVADEVQDLGLDGHVQGCRRLVGDEVVRLGRQRDGDHHALLLPAGQAEGIVVDAPLGLGDADALQPFDGLGPRRCAAQFGVRFNRLDNLGADAHDRVQAGRRLLEDHRDAAAPHIAHAALGQGQQVLAVQPHGAAGDAAVLGQQAHQRQRRHALAAAALAHQGEGLAARQREPHAVYGLHEAGVGVQLDLEAVDLKHAPPPSCAGTPAAGPSGTWGRRHRARRRRTGWPPAPG